MMLNELFHLLSIVFGLATLVCVGVALYLSKSSTTDPVEKVVSRTSESYFSRYSHFLKDVEVRAYAETRDGEGKLLRAQRIHKAILTKDLLGEENSQLAYVKRIVEVDVNIQPKIERRANQIPRRLAQRNYMGRINKQSATMH
jgi:hypothetical protein